MVFTPRGSALSGCVLDGSLVSGAVLTKLMAVLNGSRNLGVKIAKSKIRGVFSRKDNEFLHVP